MAWTHRPISRFCSLAAICSTLAGASGCRRPSATTADSKKPSAAIIEPKVSPLEGPPTVLFDIKTADDVVLPNVELYDCSYQSRGRTAKFRLQLRQNHPLSGEVLPLAAAEGKFLAVPNSDNSALLEDLMKALDAKQLPQPGPRLAELAFDAVVLGERQSRSSAGGYSANPPGQWKLIKIFLPKGGDDGEIFLNVNAVLGKAEFSIKDSDYGDYIVGQLAKVL